MENSPPLHYYTTLIFYLPEDPEYIAVPTLPKINHETYGKLKARKGSKFQTPLTRVVSHIVIYSNI